PVSITLSSQLTNRPSSAGKNVSALTSATAIEIQIGNERPVLDPSAFAFTARNLALGILPAASTPHAVRHLPCNLDARQVPDRPLLARQARTISLMFSGACVPVFHREGDDGTARDRQRDDMGHCEP